MVAALGELWQATYFNFEEGLQRHSWPSPSIGILLVLSFPIAVPPSPFPSPPVPFGHALLS